MSSSSIDNEDTINIAFKSLSRIPDYVWDSTHVRKLVAAGNPITYIPPQLSQLTNLQILNLGSSEISSFPSDSFPHLQSLTYLNLSENKLSEIPDNIGLLTNLTDLIISGNSFVHVPPSIGQLTALNILKLGKCKLTRLPSTIAQLASLKELHLSENQFSGPIPSFLFRLPSLEFLDLSLNKFDSLLDVTLAGYNPQALGAFFKNVTKLRVLTLSDNLLTSLPPFTIGNFQTLEVLQLEFNRITTLPDDIGNLRQLERLELSSNKLITLPASLGSLGKLASLNVSYNDLTDVPNSLNTLTSLRLLNVIGNDFEHPPPVCAHLAEQGVKVRANDENLIPNNILPGLFLGGVVAARDKYTLKRLGIRHILTVAEIDPLYAEDFVYKVVRVDDHADQDLTVFFEECRKFIEDGILAGGVLVHCAAGVSRSATMVIMYVMTVEHLSMEEAFEFVRSKRPIVCPNQGFREQLVSYEQVLRRENSQKCTIS